MITQKYNFKQLAFTSLIFVSVLSSGLTINTLAQDNKQPPMSLDQGGVICQRVKDNLNTKFDLSKEKQEVVPFRLQAFLDKKTEQAKTQGDNNQRLENITSKLRDGLKESQASYIKLFELFEKIKTTDCTDTKAFQELIKQTRKILQDVRMQNMNIIMDIRRQLPLLTRINRNTLGTSNQNRNNPETQPQGQNLPPNVDQPLKEGNQTMPTRPDNLPGNPKDKR